MPLRTKLTEKLGISHLILLAPMGTASGGTLARAVTEAGGLGIIGFGYGNQERIDQEFRVAGNARVGCGFITWSLARQPHLLARALEYRPAAVMLSFGDARPFASAITDAGAALLSQVQTVAQAMEALISALTSSSPRVRRPAGTALRARLWRSCRQSSTPCGSATTRSWW